jgi:hypothetical protein
MRFVGHLTRSWEPEVIYAWIHSLGALWSSHHRLMQGLRCSCYYVVLTKKIEVTSLLHALLHVQAVFLPQLLPHAQFDPLPSR